MITHEQDPDVVRWGLQLFDGDPYSNSSYYGSLPQNSTACYENHYITEFNGAEHSELTANSLQEQFSQFSLSEQSPNFPDGVGNAQASFYQQDWFGPPVANYTFGEDSGEVASDLITSRRCPSPEGESYSGQWSYSLELMDEYALDGELGKRLNQMVPIPHIPKINGEIPSLDEATLDHQRLLERLQVYDLVECKILGDGNCQFRALSDQFYRTPEHHEFVRQEVVNQLKSCPETYEGYVPMAYDDYLEKISKNGEWGDHVTLQAAADSYGVKIFVITSFKDTCYIEILPSTQKSERVIFLSFWAEVHYNSIYPKGDIPKSETKRKKRRSLPQQQHLEPPDESK
ncbi:OLC1v1003845C2 [Oldenlandia corymbosa var. corymbosa]|uniref:ubiquitinyl hydrolase 1 n=1 Tax=Oldenlandia corymbosa var. corymbosa TaxID=529605 RepID=A0AAV1DDX7_OLDCO|nr:OLC1v1003845C2 [Oldenlandia corymbosa var. corymbosa]